MHGATGDQRRATGRGQTNGRLALRTLYLGFGVVIAIIVGLTLVGLLFIDLDGFKGVNDRHGHDHGDELLRQVAHRLKALLRQEDIVARVGGDEFTTILPDLATRESAATVAHRIVADLGRPFQVYQVECRIGASVGVSFFPLDGDELDILIRVADDRMYAVKRSGKGGFQLDTTPA